jgi:hypothetical protein
VIGSRLLIQSSPRLAAKEWVESFTSLGASISIWVV